MFVFSNVIETTDPNSDVTSKQVQVFTSEEAKRLFEMRGVTGESYVLLARYVKDQGLYIPSIICGMSGNPIWTGWPARTWHGGLIEAHNKLCQKISLTSLDFKTLVSQGIQKPHLCLINKDKYPDITKSILEKV